ncbi:MAG: microviridin/marinostatin family tricyclic proteinase inhibitor [Acidobacteriota bacterium]|nr:microviridin/marinostatin family tricyclic proteinase inhibitor [Acidobacteriota bacterium]
MTSPFFTRFLQDQKIDKEQTKAVQGGKPDQTMKYPSDNDEW